jgi:hypothetical protein
MELPGYKPGEESEGEGSEAENLEVLHSQIMWVTQENAARFGMNPADYKDERALIHAVQLRSNEETKELIDSLDIEGAFSAKDHNLLLMHLAQRLIKKVDPAEFRDFYIERPSNIDAQAAKMIVTAMKEKGAITPDDLRALDQLPEDLRLLKMATEMDIDDPELPNILDQLEKLGLL